MSSKFLLRSFAGGEITPELAGRLDLVKYQTGLATCRNFVTLPHGPATRRPGTEFIAEVLDSSRKVRLIPFTFSADQTAVLELGHEYIRVHINGGALLEENKTIGSIAADTVTLTAHGYVAGDWIYIGGVFYVVASATTDTFTVTDLAGAAGAPSGTIAARVFTLATPYQEADLFDIHYAQSADVVTLTHPSYATRELSRLSEVSWSLTTVSFAPPDGVPTGVSATPTVAVDEHKTQAKYVVTAVADDGITETLPSAPATATNNLTLAGNFNTITWDPVDGYSRYNVYKLRGGVYGYIGQVTPTAGASAAIATATPYQDLGFFKFGRVRVTTSSAHGLASGDSVYIEGTGYFDGVYTVIVESTTVFNYAKVTRFAVEVTTGTAYIPTLSLVDDNVQADTTQSPPENIVSLNKGTGDYPATTVYHEQRRWFGGTIGKPQVLWATRTGTDDNLTSSIPTRDADGMEVRVASSQYNQIRHLVALSDLIALTAGGEFRIFADGAPAITPTSISIKPQGYSGASNVQPVVTAGTVMYVQAQGSRIRELSYSWEASSYRTTDASIMAPHRFNYHTVVDLAFSRTPDPILWAVRDDGLLLGMTYVPDQQVYGWHAHDTAGKFESVTVVPEGNEDMLYAVVQREIGARSVRYIERLGTRYFSKLAYANFVDCGASLTTEQDLTDVVFSQVNSSDAIAVESSNTRVFYITEIGSEVWVLLFDYTSGDPILRINIYGTDAVFKRTVTSSAKVVLNNYRVVGVCETDEEIYVSASNAGTASTLRINKNDPTDQLHKTTAPYARRWMPTPGGNQAWTYSGSAFQLWSFTTNSTVSTWNPPTGAAPRSDATVGFDVVRAAVVLSSGSIAYQQTSATQNTRLYLLGGNNQAEYIELPTRTANLDGSGVYGEIVRNLVELQDLNVLYVLTTQSVIKIDLGTKQIVANYAHRWPLSAFSSPGFDVAYDATRKYLFWASQDGESTGIAFDNVKLIVFDAQACSEVVRYPFPTDRSSTDEIADFNHTLKFLESTLWGSANMIFNAGESDGTAVLAMHV